MSQFRLNEAEKNSALWMRLTEHLEERLKIEREALEKSQPIEPTEYRRGKIAQLKELQKLGAAETDSGR